jgi:MFS family permease
VERFAEAPARSRSEDATPRRKTRGAVVAFGASLAFLSFLDRAAISQAAPAIVRDLRLSPVQLGLVFSAFGLTYAACEIPSGWLCDRFGARRLLIRVVLVWSLLTAATGAAWNFPSLIIIRLLFGAGESGCFPGLARLFRTWLPPDERNSAEGMKAAAARWGAAITPALMALLSAFMTWREVFALFGATGIVWAAVFHRWYGSRSESDALSRAKRPINWSRLLRSRSIWALGAQWFSHYYGFYFYITWLPIYLYQARGLDIRRGAIAAGLPLFAAGAGSIVAGWTLAWLTRRIPVNERSFRLTRIRRGFGYAAYGGAAALLLVFTRIDNPPLAILTMSLSSFAAEFSGPITWTSAMDIGREHVGTVSGFMNMLGHFGGAVAPAVTGLLLAATGNAWNVAFCCSALIYSAGALCWRLIDPTTPLELD